VNVPSISDGVLALSPNLDDFRIKDELIKHHGPGEVEGEDRMTIGAKAPNAVWSSLLN